MIEDFIKKNSITSGNVKFLMIDKQEYDYYTFDQMVSSAQILLNKLSPNIKYIKLKFENKLMLLVSLIACNRCKKIPILYPDENLSINTIDYSGIIEHDYELNDINCIIQEYKDNHSNPVLYRESDIQCILFTSGTESVPKAVELTFNNIYQSAMNWNAVLNFSTKDYYLNILSLSHISGLSIFFRSIYAGFKTIVFKYDKENLLKWINEYDIKYVSVIPKIINDLMNCDHAKKTLKKLNALIVGGDEINNEIFSYFSNNNINAYISYGMTETSSGIIGYFIKDIDKYKIGYLGTPHKSVNISLDGKFIKIKSSCIMYRYVNSKKCNEIFKSNDIGIKKGNRIYFKSRLENIIISGGENVNLSIIRDLIKKHKLVDDVLIVGVSNERWGKIPVAIYEARHSKVIERKLKDYCNNNLPNFMRPKHYIQINHIPKLKNDTPNLKLINYYIQESIK